MRKNTIIFVLDLIAIGLLTCLVAFPEAASKIDDILLLEKAHPGYWNNLSESTAKVFYVKNDMDTRGGHGNQLILNHRYYVPSTIDISASSDGTLKILGTINDKAQYIYLTSDYYIGPGHYALSLGRDLDWNHMYAYVEHYDSEGNRHRLVEITDNEVEFDVDEYMDVNLILCLGVGEYELMLTPTMRYLEDCEDIGPAVFDSLFTNEKYEKVVVHNVEQSDITEKDVKIFENYISHIGIQGKWESVVEEDGHGIQYFSDGSSISGRMDSLGRVIR